MSSNYVIIDVNDGAVVEISDVVLVTPIAYGIYLSEQVTNWQRLGSFRAYFSTGFWISFRGEVDVDGVDYCETLEQWYKMILEGMKQK
jgi:hypothetical protein